MKQCLCSYSFAVNNYAICAVQITDIVVRALFNNLRMMLRNTDVRQCDVTVIASSNGYTASE